MYSCQEIFSICHYKWFLGKTFVYYSAHSASTDYGKDNEFTESFNF